MGLKCWNCKYMGADWDLLEYQYVIQMHCLRDMWEMHDIDSPTKLAQVLSSAQNCRYYDGN